MHQIGDVKYEGDVEVVFRPPFLVLYGCRVHVGKYDGEDDGSFSVAKFVSTEP